MRRLRLAALVLFAAAPKYASDANAQTCPAITLVSAANQLLSSPIFVTHAGDGTNRLFIVEQPGVIKVIQPGSKTPTVFLRIPGSKIVSGGERGLLGLAFHPNFASNRRFFVNYTASSNGRTVIAEYKASAVNPNVAAPSANAATETVLLSFLQPFSNHNGGSMAFGPDGFLYSGSGDGGSGNDPGNRAQDVNTPLGKILRIDVDTPNGPVPYSSPGDNPYAGATPGLDEIYAIGMRNPWRISFDRLTGQLIAGDVGQGSREEISLITLGGNYGWRVMEGTRCAHAGDALPCGSPEFTEPAFEYTHGSGRCSVTGGYVYRGPADALPEGTYVFGDFCTGEIFGLDIAELPFDPDDLPSSPPVVQDTTLLLSSFGEDEAGEIYAVGLGGSVSRIAPTVRISPTSESFDEIGGQGAVEVDSPSPCPDWTTVSNVPWITIDSGADGDGDGTVLYTVASNPGVPPRNGTITIAGHTFEVEQEGGPASLISIDDVVVSEGAGQATFTVSLTPAGAETITVGYATSTGTATELDFGPVLDTLIFDAGETSKQVVIDIEADDLDEDDETFFLVLSSAVGAAIVDGEGVGTITDDDAMPSLSIAGTSFLEGFDVRRVALPVTLDAASGRTVMVGYTIGPGSATPGADFRAETGTLEFAPGETRKSLFVWTKGDRADEPDEDFLVDLQGPVNATIATAQATAIIQDDDPPPRTRSAP